MDENDIFDKEWELIGFVVAQFNELELKASKVLTRYIEPSNDKEEFFESYILNNSVVSFGGKVKLLSALNKTEKLVKFEKDKFHRLLALRNAIAHNDIIGKYKTHIPLDPEEDISTYFVIDQMKSDGTLRTLNKSEAYGEFIMLYEEADKQLNEMLEKLCKISV